MEERSPRRPRTLPKAPRTLPKAPQGASRPPKHAQEGFWDSLGPFFGSSWGQRPKSAPSAHKSGLRERTQIRSERTKSVPGAAQEILFLGRLSASCCENLFLFCAITIPLPRSECCLLFLFAGENNRWKNVVTHLSIQVSE